MSLITREVSEGSMHSMRKYKTCRGNHVASVITQIFTMKTSSIYAVSKYS